jgi:hypothetical protein
MRQQLLDVAECSRNIVCAECRRPGNRNVVLSRHSGEDSQVLTEPENVVLRWIDVAEVWIGSADKLENRRRIGPGHPGAAD